MVSGKAFVLLTGAMIKRPLDCNAVPAFAAANRACPPWPVRIATMPTELWQGVRLRGRFAAAANQLLLPALPLVCSHEDPAQVWRQQRQHGNVRGQGSRSSGNAGGGSGGCNLATAAKQPVHCNWCCAAVLHGHCCPPVKSPAVMSKLAGL